jgi:hypothetical protein
MTKDNSTGKNKDFYELGKKMFDRLNPHIAHNPKVIGPEQEPAAWMVYTEDGQSVYVTDNPTDIQEGQRALPLYVTPPPQRTWVGLTDDEKQEAYYKIDLWSECIAFIEAKLKEKNT